MSRHAKVPPDAADLVAALLQPDLTGRLGVDGFDAVQSHHFFEGLEPSTLYTQSPPPLAGGIAPPTPNAAWSRRQNSMMWAPLPQRYSFEQEGAAALEPVAETEAEAGAFFLKQLHALFEIKNARAGASGVI